MDNLVFLQRKGGKVLLFEGRQFYKHKDYKCGNTIWKCSKAKKEKCCGSITLKGTHIIKNRTHNCMADFGKNAVDESIAKMKTETRLSDTPVPQIYKKTINELKSDGIHFVSKIPNLQNIKTSLYSYRNCTNFKEIQKVTVPSTHDEFILADYLFENCRIIIFCSDENRKLITEIDEFFIDGTFQSCPGPFTQLYSIHGDISKSTSKTHVIPLVYALMSHKDEKSYYALFQMIKSQTSWNPKKVHLDFETAAAKALKEVYPGVMLKKCYYHFTKSLWKKAKEMKIKSKNERRIIGLFTALPLLPIDLVMDGVAYINDEKPATEKICRFITYVQRTWLKNKEFISQWNVYGERHRTNNVVESWHSQVNKEVKKRLPKSILRLLNILRDIENEVSEASPRRQEHMEQDDLILKNQLQLVHGEISLGHFLEKMR